MFSENRGTPSTRTLSILNDYHQPSSSPGPFSVSSPGPFSTSSPIVENRKLGDVDHDMMNLPMVRELSATVAMQNAKIINLLEAQTRLHEEKAILLEEKAVLHSEVAHLQAERVVSLQKQTNMPPSTPSQSTTAAVLTSPAITAFPGAGQSVRPEAYPESILWSLQDCQRFNLVKKSNQSRPNMGECIRKPDGTVIQVHEYNNVKVSTRLIVFRDLVTLKCPNIPEARSTSRTKSWYIKYHFVAWQKAIMDLEHDEPLLTLCAAHWKAIHMLGQCLQAAVGDTENPGASNVAKETGGSKRVRSESVHEEEATPNAKRAHTTPVTSLLNTGKVGGKGKSSKKDKKRASDDGSKRKDTNENPTSTTSASLSQEIASLGSPTTSGSGTIVGPTCSEVKSKSAVEVNFIRVDKSFISLKDEFQKGFVNLSAAIELICALEACPAFRAQPPSDRMVAFINRIENADPNAADLSEDDDNASWGHKQFTAGDLTCATVLTSWEEVGNCDSACSLLSAALKTCKVAEFLCFERNIAPSSYLSRIYLEQVVDRLFDCWKQAGGPLPKGKEKAPAGLSSDPDGLSQATQAQTANAGDGDPRAPSSSGAVKGAEVFDKAALEELLKSLTKDDIKTWMEGSNLKGKKSATKQDLTNVVHTNLALFSAEALEKLVNLSKQRIEQKSTKSRRSKS